MSSEQETKTNEINKTRNNMTDFLIHPSFLSIDIIDSTPPHLNQPPEGRHEMGLFTGGTKK